MRRSRCIATSGMAGTAMPEVLMWKLGILAPDQGLTQDAQDAYAQLFDNPLSQAQLSALALIFGWIVPENLEACTTDLLIT